MGELSGEGLFPERGGAVRSEGAYVAGEVGGAGEQAEVGAERRNRELIAMALSYSIELWT